MIRARILLTRKMHSSIGVSKPLRDSAKPLARALQILARLERDAFMHTITRFGIPERKTFKSVLIMSEVSEGGDVAYALIMPFYTVMKWIDAGCPPLKNFNGMHILVRRNRVESAKWCRPEIYRFLLAIASQLHRLPPTDCRAITFKGWVPHLCLYINDPRSLSSM